MTLISNVNCTIAVAADSPPPAVAVSDAAGAGRRDAVGPSQSRRASHRLSNSSCRVPGGRERGKVMAVRAQAGGARKYES